MNIQIYTDASFDDNLRIATCGYRLFFEEKLMTHEVYTVEKLKDSTDAEVYSAILGLRKIKEMCGQAGYSVIIYTDCMLICHLLNKCRNKLKGTSTDFIKLISEFKNDGVKVVAQFVKGHKRNKGYNGYQNHVVDCSVRKVLREQRVYYKQQRENNF